MQEVHWFNRPLNEGISLIVELLRRLETEVDAPPCWLCTSLTTVGFFHHDVAVYVKQRAGDILFNVGCDRVPNGSSRSVPTIVIFGCANKTHQLNTVDEAIQTIIFILREAGVVKAGENDLSAR